jgi:hypothetical protein
MKPLLKHERDKSGTMMTTSAWATFSMECQTHYSTSIRVAILQRNCGRNWSQDICRKMLQVRSSLSLSLIIIKW